MSNVVEIVVKGTDKSGASTIKEVDKSTKALGEESKRTESKMGGLKVAALAVAGSGLVEFLKGSVEEARAAQKTMAQTAAVIKSTGGEAHVTADDVDQMAKSLARNTGVSSDVIQTNENLLLTFTGIRNEVGKGNDIFNQATKAALDMSVALKEDGKSASIQLGKALQDPIKGATALRRVGVALTTQQQAQIKTFVNSGRTMLAQKLILGELTKEFGGSAQAQATAGAKAAETWRQLREQLGTRLLPVIDKVATGFSDLVHGVTGDVGSMDQSARPKLELLGLALHAMIVAFQGGGVTSRGFVGAMEQVGVALRGVWDTMNVLIHQGLSLMQSSWTTIGSVLRNVVVPALRDTASFLSTHTLLVRAAVVGVLAFIAVWQTAKKVREVITGIGEALKFASANPFTIIIAGVIALTAAFIYAYTHSTKFRDTVDHVIDNVQHAFDNFMHAVDNFVHAFDNVLHAGDNVVHAFNNVWHAGQNVVQFFKSAYLDIKIAALNIGIAFTQYLEIPVLNVFSAIVHGAASAFGWVPGVGGKLKAARASFDNFRKSVDRDLSNMRADLSTAQAQRNANTLTDRINRLRSALNSLPTSVGAGVNAVGQITIAGGGRYASGGVIAAATGGARGGAVMTDEHGPEIKRYPNGTMVYPAGQSAGMASHWGGGQQTIVLELRSSGTAVDNFLLELLRKAIRVRGGNVQIVLGR